MSSCWRRRTGYFVLRMQVCLLQNTLATREETWKRERQQACSLWQVEHDLATEAPLAIPVYDLSPRPDEPTNWPQSLIGRFMRNRRVPAGLDRKGLGSGIDDSPPTTVL